MNRSVACVVVLLALFASFGYGAGQGDQPKPMILIYCQDVPSYGNELASILKDDTRMDAEILVVSDTELFKAMLYFPYVRVLVALFNQDRNDGLSEHLETFFDEGGGVVGLGFAGWFTTTRNASRDVFSLAANVYVTGRYNRTLGTFTHSLHVDELHEINAEVGDFTALTQRMIMNVNKTTGTLVPPWPEGKVKVLYREETQNAPVMIVHEDKGVCVTFGGFTGDPVEDVPTYFGYFTGTPEFRALFSNSVFYAWENEDRYGTTSDSATSRFGSEKEEIDRVMEEAQDSQRTRKNAVLLRHGLVVGAAAAVSIIAFRYGFMSREGKGGEGGG